MRSLIEAQLHISEIASFHCRYVWQVNLLQIANPIFKLFDVDALSTFFTLKGNPINYTFLLHLLIYVKINNDQGKCIYRRYKAVSNA